MDDLGALHYQQQLEQQQQEEDYFSFKTNHPTYHEFQIDGQCCEDRDLILNIGQGGCKLWIVLTREDAQKLAHCLSLVTR